MKLGETNSSVSPGGGATPLRLGVFIKAGISRAEEKKRVENPSL